MRYILVLMMFVTLGLTGCRPKELKANTRKPTAAAPYPNLGPAPELTNQTWLNTTAPVRLANQRGKVVLIDMWTFG
jgi:hypothetical protein